MIQCSFRSTLEKVFTIEIPKSPYNEDSSGRLFETWGVLAGQIHRNFLAGRVESAILEGGSVRDRDGFAKPLMSFTKFIAGISSLEARKSVDGAVLVDTDPVFDGESLVLFRKPIDEKTRAFYQLHYRNALARQNPPADESVNRLRREINARMPELPPDGVCQQYHREIRSFALEEAVYWLSRLPRPPGVTPFVPPVAAPQGSALAHGVPKNFVRKNKNIGI